MNIIKRKLSNSPRYGFNRHGFNRPGLGRHGLSAVSYTHLTLPTKA